MTLSPTAIGMSSSDKRNVAADDYLTVELLCAGLAKIRLDRQHALEGHAPVASDPSAGLLPRAWRTAFTRLWWVGHHQSVNWPQDDLDVLSACRLPIGEWPVRLDLSDADLDQPLLEGDELSEFSEQASALATKADVEAELVENQIFAQLLATAQANGRTEEDVQQAYVELRLMHIRHPVLSDLDVLRRAQRMPAASTSGEPHFKQLIHVAYRFQQAPGGAALRVCGSCGNPMPGVDRSCQVPGCQGHAVQKRLRTLEGYWVQHRATRRYHHDPGLVEARIFDAINGLPKDIVCLEEYPWLDAWDGAVRFHQPGSGQPESWLFDAKDCVSATLLGRRFTCDRRLRANRLFLVVAQQRATPAYFADLIRELDGRVSGIEVVDEDTFIRQVTTRSKEVGQHR
ncbi:restriction endonuclease-related protein [Streptomyces griseochromogenes]|uniref:restriction endonuclease-related protein n=1 Tax=Streptomyces griseochromogenes TaxID=68214 RepID=UPI0037B2A249